MANLKEYLYEFETHADYERATGLNKSNVCYCKDVKDVHYNPYTWENDYLTMIALENGTISFMIGQNVPVEDVKSISYSINNGKTWVTTDNVDDKEENLVITVDVNKGNTVLWKGEAKQFYSTDMCKFESSCKYNLCGNIMSMLYNDDFKDKTEFPNDTQMNFFYLFVSLSQSNNYVVDASNLVLPATTLTLGCYFSMFSYSDTLVSCPKLPATTLANNCYAVMFQGCTSLKSAPQLPATTLVEGCYGSMFQGCTSLKSAPQLPATTLVTDCYSNMFKGCTSLTTAPELPATTLVTDCYQHMFQGCTSLKSAPQLPATTLTDGCYQHMFEGCTSLTTAPELHATTLTDGCYKYMFKDCTSLTTAPELHATTLTHY